MGFLLEKQLPWYNYKINYNSLVAVYHGKLLSSLRS